MKRHGDRRNCFTRTLVNRTCGCIAWLGLTFLTSGMRVSAETLALIPIADTSIMENAPEFNLGAQEDLPAGTLGALANFARTRILLKFDLAGSLPAKATIRSALLRLTVTRTPDGGGANSIFGLHRVLRPWGEGTKKGNPPGGAAAGAQEATWRMRFHPDQSWASPGGQPGVDYVATASSSERILGTGSYEFEFGSDQVRELQEWLDNSNADFGWAVLSQSEDVERSARRFGAREHPQPASRPTLTIEYSAPRQIERPVITSISFTNGQTAITFRASAGIRYGLQFHPSLSSSEWQPLPLLPPALSDGELTLTDDAVVGSERFYRILATE